MHRRCSFAGCGNLAAVALVGGEYCIAHFIMACYKCVEEFSERPIDEETERNVKEQRDLLMEVVDKVSALSLNSIAFTNQERGQLMDILLWTCDLLATERTQKVPSRGIPG
jgi:hypothetical protein